MSTSRAATGKVRYHEQNPRAATFQLGLNAGSWCPEPLEKPKSWSSLWKTAGIQREQAEGIHQEIVQQLKHKTHMDLIDFPRKIEADSAAMEFQWEGSLKMAKWENYPTMINSKVHGLSLPHVGKIIPGVVLQRVPALQAMIQSTPAVPPTDVLSRKSQGF